MTTQRPRRPDRAARPNGFTLLEVLVAFAISAAALGVLNQAVLSGLDASLGAARMQQALSRAQSRLAVLEVLPRLLPADRGGDDGGGFRWHEHIAQIEAPPQASEDRAAVALYALRVEVSWQILGRVRAVSLASERAALVAAP